MCGSSQTTHDGENRMNPDQLPRVAVLAAAVAGALVSTSARAVTTIGVDGINCPLSDAIKAANANEPFLDCFPAPFPPVDADYALVITADIALASDPASELPPITANIAFASDA